MNTVELPIVYATASPNDVWSVLHEQKRSAAIYFDRPGVPRIVFNRDVVAAMRRGADEIRRARFAPIWLARPRILAGEAPRQAIEAFDVSRDLRKLRRQPFRIGVLQAHRETAFVIAENAMTLRRLAAQPAECFCKGIHMHGYYRPAPARCEWDNAVVECY